MKLLLLGKNGQVGWELQRSLAPLGDVVALDRKAVGGDIADLNQLTQMIRALAPDVIVNAAAHTSVDKAEGEPEIAMRLNAEAPEIMAQEALNLGSLLVHYSTDYVFEGGGNHPRKETEATAPLSVYGKTKLEGEKRIEATGCRHLIFRTSWVYAARGSNFVKTMLKLAQEREELCVINEQWGAPTGADLIADVTSHAIRHVVANEQDLGLYHLSASGETNWHAYASYVIQKARSMRPDIAWVVKNIDSVSTAQKIGCATRPLNSRLDTGKIQSAMHLNLPIWQAGVDRVLHTLLDTDWFGFELSNDAST